MQVGLPVLVVRKRMEFPDKWRRIVQVKDVKRAKNHSKVATWVYWFPITVTTNFHKHSGLKQHNLLSYHSECQSTAWVSSAVLLKALVGNPLAKPSAVARH